MPLYLAMAGIFFVLSILTIYLLQRYFLESRILLDSRLLSPGVLTGLVLLLPLYYLTDGLRLYLVVRAMGYIVSFRFIMRLVFVNIFFSNATPMATGGGFIQIYFLTRNGISIGEATAATSIRTLFAALSMLTLAPVFFFLEPNLFDPFRDGRVYVYFVGVAGLYLTLVFLVLFRVRLFKALLYRLMRFFHRSGILSRRCFRRVFLRLSREMGFFSEGFRRFVKGPPLCVLGAFLSTCLFLLSLFSFSVVLIKGLQYEVPAVTIFAIQSVVTFFMYFTPTPGAVGFAESSYMLLFSKLVGQHDITLLTISWRFLTIYIGVLIGILVAYREMFRACMRRPG
ncbi:MAG: flippase-like domain-containing protein [bacterium]|nr:MAG: flippase-like domain-containing protein [bacterium]